MKYYVCRDCECKCTISAPKENSIEKLNFPCKGVNFKEITECEYKKEVKK